MGPTLTPSDRLRALIVGDRVEHVDTGRLLDAGGLAGLVEFDPEEWEPEHEGKPFKTDPGAADADPVERSSWVDPLDQVAQGLSRLGMPGVLVERCVAALPSLARLHAPSQRMGSEAALGLAEAGAVLTSGLEASRLLAARDLAVEAGEVMLAEKGVSDEGEMSRTARERWRASARSVAAHELIGVTGLGKGKAFELVALAMAPEALLGPVVHGLRTGVCRGQQVSAFWRRCRNLGHEAGTAVAQALFGKDPRTVVVERLDPLGAVAYSPWVDAPFYMALEREAKRFEAVDPQGAALRRKQAHEGRDAFGIIDDDGSGQVVIGGDGAATTACTDRLHEMAKKAKTGGDERSLSQLRADIGRALLLYGTITLPDLDCAGLAAFCGDPGLLAPAGLEELARILAGTPAYELQVIVPWDVLIGQALLPTTIVNPVPTEPVTASRCSCTSQPTAEALASDSAVDANAEPDAGVGAEPDADADRRDPDSTRPPETSAGRSSAFWPGDSALGTATPGDDAPGAAEPFGAGPAGALGPFGGGSGLPVGRVLGRHPVFLSRAQILAIAGGPGVMFARLLIDPADGRCLERTVSAYRPDAAMRAQVAAADVTSRFPFSTTLVRDGDIDHVIPYAAGGLTREDDLQGLDRPSHILKTRDLWQAVMDAFRNVTWTSYFGRTYQTRPHDYRQYLARDYRAYLATRQPVDPRDGLGDDGRGDGRHGDGHDIEGGKSSDHGVVGWRDLPMSEQTRARYQLQERQVASLLVYAALVERQRGARLEGPEDDPGEELVCDSYRAVWVRHTRPDGRKVDGPRPGTPTPEQLLQTDPGDLLAAADWTQAPTVATKRETDYQARLERLEAIEREAARARWEDRLAAATRHRRDIQARVRSEAEERARAEAERRKERRKERDNQRKPERTAAAATRRPRRTVHPDLAHATQEVTRTWQDDPDSPIPF